MVLLGESFLAFIVRTAFLDPRNFAYQINLQLLVAQYLLEAGINYTFLNFHMLDKFPYKHSNMSLALKVDQPALYGKSLVAGRCVALGFHPHPPRVGEMCGERGLRNQAWRLHRHTKAGYVRLFYRLPYRTVRRKGTVQSSVQVFCLLT